MSVRDEILEQPTVAARLLASGRPTAETIAAAVRDRPVELVVIAARGSSDHAAIYAQYVLGARNRLPVALATPSLVTLYGVSPRLERALVIGISQSGASPDVAGVVAAARTQGALTVAVTNEPASPLASAAEWLMELRAGPERAVAATKTYTAQLLAISMISAALARDEAAWAELGRVPAWLAGALSAEGEARRVAADQAGLDRCVVLARGFSYATAREWALKLKELGRVFADPYSAADFRHGPVALVEPGFPVFALASAGAAFADAVEAIRWLRDEYGAEVLVVSDRTDAHSLGRWSLSVPSVGEAEWLGPIVEVVPTQLHALHLARAKGLDPDRPRHLRKVTLTR